MKIIVKKTVEQLGKTAAEICKDLIEKTLQKQEVVRIAFSTGASQFELIEALLHEDIDWSKVEMFHLDEYVALPETHPASFRKYLKERFTSHVQLKSVCFVSPDEQPKNELLRLEKEVHRAPIDIGLIGIGENAHIAFNDPPADFENTHAYAIVKLNDACKIQQVREGWFATQEDVPQEAISMTVHEIMAMKNIVSCVPGSVKAQAIKNMLTHEVDNLVPATILKTHPNVTLVLDENSAAQLTLDEIEQCR